MAEKKQAMVVTLSGDRAIHEVAHDLKTAGFEVGQVLETIGSVTGSADPKKIAHFRGIRGVADVSRDYQVNTAVPDSKDT